MMISLAGAYDLLNLCVKSYVIVRIMKAVFVIFKSILIHYVSPEHDISDLKEMWTVVTGCTDGIGRAYIQELAISRGMRKFFLIGRSVEKLRVVKIEMEERYGAEIKTHVFDFEKDHMEILQETLKGLEVGILVNCAGIAPHLVASHMELPDGLPSRILRVNLLSTVKMIETVMPGMVQRNRGIIVNMSSITGWRPLPYMSAYPASKAAINFFSDALRDELKHTNVRVQCLIPLLVATKIASYSPEDEPSVLVVSAKDYVRQAVRIIGKSSPTTGCVTHDVEVALASLIGFWTFKQVFVPFGILGIHRKRVADYAKRMKLDG
ncbi:putative oxidoreductase dhs-27 [Toxocara canis]|uniref:Putative oxidoreductase dhs-27 n=2 Tax=Toxocara canis TaxID=6265 RepID=A0A0B2VR60_TOXCA|nr:putative oxidoreductase dhs-27 [Toxocara canis]VDM46765.1 unnamed protein product [Toxocara canis]